jgi:hypothetical protein
MSCLVSTLHCLDDILVFLISPAQLVGAFGVFYSSESPDTKVFSQSINKNVYGFLLASTTSYLKLT